MSSLGTGNRNGSCVLLVLPAANRVYAQASWELQGPSAGVQAREAAGLPVRDDVSYPGFRHRVDHAIVRDVIAARRP